MKSLAGQVGGGPHGDAVVLERDPRRALERAREMAGADGAVVATGSIYLVADLLSGTGGRGIRRASSL